MSDETQGALPGEHETMSLRERLENGGLVGRDLLEVTSKLLDQGRLEKDDDLVALALLWRGREVLFGSEDGKQARTLLFEALDHERASGDLYLMGRTYVLLGLDALLSGQLLLSFNFLNMALDCSQQVGGTEAIRLDALAHSGLGYIYGYLGDYNRGLDYALHAMTLDDSLDSPVGTEWRISNTAAIAIGAIETGKQTMAAVWLNAVHDYAWLMGKDSMTPSELYLTHEPELYVASARGRREAEAHEAEAMASALGHVQGIGTLFFSICRDVRRLLDDGLIDQAGHLIDAARPTMQLSRRSFVRLQFLRQEIAWRLARGERDEASRLSLMLYEEGEKQQAGENAQALEGVRMLGGLRDTQATNVRLSYQARHDELTHLRNRQGLREDYPKNYGHHVCAVALDVDKFKEFNDELGHAVGDLVLQGVTRAIRASFKGARRCYRTGGDEFLVLICDSTEESVRESIMALRTNISDPLKGVGADISLTGGRVVTMSAGYAAGPVSNADELRALVQRADEKLYESKRGGRDRMTGVWDE